MFPLKTAVLRTDFEMVIPRDSRIQDDTFSVEGRFFLYGKLEPKISTILGINFVMFVHTFFNNTRLYITRSKGPAGPGLDLSS